ncbi:MAG: biopolymer transporter ExbD [Waddliaceae bacterium]
MRRRTKTKDLEEPQVNLTPLIDVVFVILIIFIVIAPILELQKIELANAPSDQVDSLSVQEKGPIAVHITKNDQIRLNEQLILEEELVHRLRVEKQKHPKDCPQIFCDKNAHFGIYQSVKNAAEIVGFEQIDVVLQPN